MKKRILSLALICAGLLIPNESGADTEFLKQGYLLSRFQLLPPDRGAVLYPMLEVEKFQSFLEANFDLSLSGDKFTVKSDTSVLYRVSPSGCRPGSSLPGCLVINELYLSLDATENVRALIGRHRPAWGSALTFHPAEPMNPGPDPTDPTFQRLGAWSALVEHSGDKLVLTAAWFPSISHAAIGAPSSFDARSGLLGGRVAWRPAGFDVTALAFYDIEARLPMLGASGSAIVGESSFEVHGEALVHQRREVETGAIEEGTCPVRSLGIPHRKEWDYSGILGTRWDRDDGSLVNFELMHNGDGMVGNDFDAVLSTADLLSVMCPDARLEPGDSSEEGRPQQFSSTFLRRNYAILTGIKPFFAEEGGWAKLGATATVLLGMDDFSGALSARLVYTLEESTLLRLGGLGLFGKQRTQYGILPFYALVLADVQTLF